ncbi:hypothetical protein UlMin_001420 [Ulmus minor]
MAMREVQVTDKTLVVFEHDQLYDSVSGRVLTGSWLWEAAVVLAEKMAAPDQLNFSFEGKSVIELGAGTGLPGMTAARLGASRVVLTDIGALVPGLLKNVEANGLGDRVEVRELVWGSDELGEFEVVLMSDVFFAVEEMAALAETMKRVCKDGTRILAASEVRQTTGECLNELAKNGFELVELASGIDSYAVYCCTITKHQRKKNNH